MVAGGVVVVVVVVVAAVVVTVVVGVGVVAVVVGAAAVVVVVLPLVGLALFARLLRILSFFCCAGCVPPSAPFWCDTEKSTETGLISDFYLRNSQASLK